MEENFWRDKKVLITGHTGFKGGWLSIWLHHLKADVTGISLPADEPSLFRAAGIENLVSSYYADITDSSAISDLIVKTEPEIVFHLAAQPLVRRSYADPLSTLNTNIMGTANILESAKVCASIKTIVVVTSDKCYRNNDWVWGYRETDALGGKDPYSCSKACTELVVESYRHSFLEHKRINVATARAGNVIGGGDWGEDRLVPDLLSAYSTGKPIAIRFPHAIRPWQHVCEPLHGYLLLAQKLSEYGAEYAQAWNFGPPFKSSQTVDWIVKYLEARLPSLPYAVKDTLYLHESQTLRLDNTKSRTRLGWQPVLTIEQALDLTVEWHQAWVEERNMTDFSRNQIIAFREKIDLSSF